MARSEHIDKRGNIDFAGMMKAAEEEKAEREENSRQAWEATRQKSIKEVEKQQAFFDGIAANIMEQKQKEADYDIRKDIAAATKEIEEKHYNSKSIKRETEKDRAYKSLLKGLKDE